jgi:hypothetical protein
VTARLDGLRQLWETLNWDDDLSDEERDAGQGVIAAEIEAIERWWRRARAQDEGGAMWSEGLRFEYSATVAAAVAR